MIISAHHHRWIYSHEGEKKRNGRPINQKRSRDGGLEKHL